MKLKELFAQPGTWIQGQYARDYKGNPVDPKDPNAICWCLSGACGKVGNWLLLMNKLTNHLKMPTVTSWNDAPGRTQKEVRQLCEELDI